MRCGGSGGACARLKAPRRRNGRRAWRRRSGRLERRLGCSGGNGGFPRTVFARAAALGTGIAIIAATRAERLALRHEARIDARRARMGQRILHNLRIVATDVRRAREAAEIGGGGLLRGRQARHIAQIRRDRGGKIGGHRRAGNPFRLVALARNRHDERAHPPRAPVASFEQRLDEEFGTAAVTRDHQAQRIAADGLVALGRFLGQAGNRKLVLALRRRVVTGQIIGKAALGGHLCTIEAGLIREIKPADRLERLVRTEHGNADARPYARIARRNLLGAAQKADCRIGITQIKRSTAGIEQRAHVPRIARQPCERGIEHARGAGRGGLDNGDGRGGSRLRRVIVHCTRLLRRPCRHRQHKRCADHQGGAGVRAKAGRMAPEPGGEEAADHGADLIAAKRNTQSRAGDNLITDNTRSTRRPCLAGSRRAAQSPCAGPCRFTGCSADRGSAEY